MVWLVVGLPVAAVAASLTLVVQALHGAPDDAIIDEVQHTAQMQVANKGPEQRAAQLGLSATLLATDKDVQVVPVTGEFDRGAPLKLTLAHPADDDHDLKTLLAPSAQGWSAATIASAGNDWILRLEAADGSWRLQGRLPRGERAVLLRPATP
jgi:hypothetical protein